MFWVPLLQELQEYTREAELLYVRRMRRSRLYGCFLPAESLPPLFNNLLVRRWAHLSRWLRPRLTKAAWYKNKIECRNLFVLTLPKYSDKMRYVSFRNPTCSDHY